MNLTRSMVLEEYNPGEFVYHKGAPADCLYVVIQGTVQTFFTRSKPWEGGKHQDTNCFGEKALHSAKETTRDHYAQCTEATSLLRLSKEEF